MRKTLPFCLAIVLVIVACGGQRGRFAASGERLRVFDSRIGGVDIVEGYTNSALGILQGPQEELLYMLIVGPVGQAHRENRGSVFGRYVTTLDYSWDTERGRYAITIRWNREKDTVSFGGQEYSRNNGNVYVVRFEENGKAVGRQLGNLASHSTHQQVLQYVQQRLTNDEVVASLKLYNLN